MYDMMVDKVVAKFGFEDARTIEFIELCECIGSEGEAWAIVHSDFEELMAESIFLDED